MSEITIDGEGFPEGVLVTPGVLVREARERWELAATVVARGHATPGVERQQHLVYALALMVEKLAEAHRAELGAVMERVRRLEERATETAPGGARAALDLSGDPCFEEGRRQGYEMARRSILTAAKARRACGDHEGAEALAQHGAGMVFGGRAEES